MAGRPIIVDAVDADQYLRENGLSRARGGIGKRMGSAVYVHRDYEDRVVPENVLEKAKAVLSREHPDMADEYNAVKYDRKKKTVTFQHSPDFDTADEPTVGDSIRVKGSSTKVTRQRGDPQIWHHKWMWVDDDYRGFDVGASKARSETWRPHIKPGESSRIGRRGYWDSIRDRWEKQTGAVTEAAWHTLMATGDLKKDLLSFYELEYKYSKVAQAPTTAAPPGSPLAQHVEKFVIRMMPRRREAILKRMVWQAKSLGKAIAEAALPTFDSWVRAHDLEHLDVMGAERLKKLQKQRLPS